MTRYVFKMPDLGEGTVEAEIVAWHVKVGDDVAEDQVMAEVMTEKAAVEVPAPVTGRVVSITGGPGDMVRVGAELIVFETEGGEDLAEPEAAPGGSSRPTSAPSSAAAPGTPRPPASRSTSARASPRTGSPRRSRPSTTPKMSGRRPSASGAPCRGVTLVELLLVILILGALLAVGVPTVAKMLRRMECASALSGVTRVLTTARLAAIKGVSGATVTTPPAPVAPRRQVLIVTRRAADAAL